MSLKPTISEPHPSSTHLLDDRETQPKSRWHTTRQTVMPAQRPGSAPADSPAKTEGNQPNYNHDHPASNSRRGHPVLFDEQKRRLFCDLVRHGFSKGKAARLLRVAPRTVQEAAQNDPRSPNPSTKPFSSFTPSRPTTSHVPGRKTGAPLLGSSTAPGPNAGQVAPVPVPCSWPIRSSTATSSNSFEPCCWK